jgi:hypothetical protein
MAKKKMQYRKNAQPETEVLNTPKAVRLLEEILRLVKERNVNAEKVLRAVAKSAAAGK